MSRAKKCGKSTFGFDDEVVALLVRIAHVGPPSARSFWRSIDDVLEII